MLDKFVIEHAAKKKPKTLEVYDRCVGLLKPIVADFRPHQLTVPKRKRYIENSELNAIAAAGSPIIEAVIDLAYVTGQRISDVLDLSLDVKDKEYVTLVQRKTGHRMLPLRGAQKRGEKA